MRKRSRLNTQALQRRHAILAMGSLCLFLVLFVIAVAVPAYANPIFGAALIMFGLFLCFMQEYTNP